MEKLEKMIQLLQKEELQKLLLAQCEKDEDLKQEIIRLTSKLEDDEDRNYIDAIFEKYDIEYVFIGEKILDFGNEIIAYLDTKVSTYVKNQERRKALELALYAIKSLEKLDFDEYDDMLYKLQERFIEIIGYVSSEAAQQGDEKVEEWIRNLYKKTGDLELKNFLEFILLEVFKDQALANVLLKEVDQELAEDEEFGLPYEEVDQIVTRKLLYLHTLDTPLLDVLEFSKKYAKYPGCLKLRIEEYIAAGYTRELLHFLRNDTMCYIDVSVEADMIIFDVFEQLKEKVSIKEYRAELSHFVLNEVQDQLGYIDLLKDCCTEKQWIKIKEQIEQANLFSFVLLDFLYEEQEFKKLLEVMKREEECDKVFNYLDELLPLYPEETLDLCFAEIREVAKISRNRNEYHVVADKIQEIADYEIGQDQISAFVEELKHTYSKKRTFIRELDRIKVYRLIHIY